eukprot:scaffold92267_cov34-Tisochrysis_lutea.AAC.3
MGGKRKLALALATCSLRVTGSTLLVTHMTWTWSALDELERNTCHGIALVRLMAKALKSQTVAIGTANSSPNAIVRFSHMFIC